MQREVGFVPRMLLEGVDLAAKVASFMRKDPNFASRASEEIFDLMLDEIVLGVCFDIHKSIKTGENNTDYRFLKRPDRN